MIIKNNLTERNETRIEHDEHDQHLQGPEMDSAQQLFQQHQLVDGDMTDSLLKHNFDQSSVQFIGQKDQASSQVGQTISTHGS